MAKRRPNGDGMVRKRADGRWEGAIVIGHKKDGKPIFKWVQATTQRELMPKLHQAIETYRGAELTEESSMTLAEWFERWFKEYAEIVLRPSTVKGYRHYAEKITPFLGDRQIKLITTSEIQKMYNRLKADGREVNREKYGAGLSDAVIRSIHMLLHEVMESALHARLIAKNPTDGTKIPKCNYKEKQVLTDAELQIFMEAIEKESLWFDFFYTEITTGLRKGEICGLKWCDLDTEKGTLKVGRTVTVDKGGVLRIGEPKTDTGKRVIRLPSSTLRILTERKENALSEWIFPSLIRPERPTSPSSAYGRLKCILQKAGLPSIRFHDLRHTFATHALTSGVDAKTLAGILGHTNASFTLDTYTHVTTDMQRNAAEIVGGFVNDFIGDEFENG